MKSYRTPLFYLLVMIMIASFVTCGYCATTKENFKPVHWRMSNQHPDGNIADTADREMIEEIRKATEGRVNITLYNNNQLGDYLSVFEEVMLGSIEIHHGSTNEGYDTRVLGPFLPYLATGYESLAKVYSPDSYLFKTLHDEVYTKLGMELMGFFCEGFDGIGSKTELKDPAVIGAEKGILLRVPAMETFNQCNRMLGFRTTSIPFADTYTSIQTGLADGASGVPANMFYLLFRDVIKYFYDYQQVQEATSILINKAAFNKLLPEDQAAMRTIIQKKCAESIELARADETKYKNMLRDAGITVMEFTDEQRQAFADECHKVVWPKLAETYTKEFLEGVMATTK